MSQKVIDYYSVSEREHEQWQQCPFIPQNGYGEIAVNIEAGNQTVVLEDPKDPEDPKHPKKGDPKVTLIERPIRADTEKGETTA